MQIKLSSIINLSALSGALLIATIACGPAEGPPAATFEDTTADGCAYSYDHATTEFKWIGFKFSEREPVGGSFDVINISNGGSDAASPLAAVQSLSFDIDTSSVNSGNEERDPKIQSAFFDIMNEPGSISGKVLGASASEGLVEINMNGATLEVPVSVTLTDNTVLEVKGSIDVVNWGASVEALNAVCHALHIGADGESKLWSEVDFEIKTVLTRDCPAEN